MLNRVHVCSGCTWPYFPSKRLMPPKNCTSCPNRPNQPLSPGLAVPTPPRPRSWRRPLAPFHARRQFVAPLCCKDVLWCGAMRSHGAMNSRNGTRVLELCVWEWSVGWLGEIWWEIGTVLWFIEGKIFKIGHTTWLASKSCHCLNCGFVKFQSYDKISLSWYFIKITVK